MGEVATRPEEFPGWYVGALPDAELEPSPELAGRSALLGVVAGTKRTASLPLLLLLPELESRELVRGLVLVTGLVTGLERLGLVMLGDGWAEGRLPPVDELPRVLPV